MTQIWILIIATLLVQEFATTTAVFTLAIQNHVFLWPIHLVWIGATFFDMYVGFSLGDLIKKRFSDWSFFKKIDLWAERTKKIFGKHGKILSLMIFGAIDFPYINAFLGSWLGLSMRMTFLTTLAGNAAWYLLVWAAVLGVHSLIADPDLLIFVIVVVGALSYFAFGYAKRSLEE